MQSQKVALIQSNKLSQFQLQYQTVGIRADNSNTLLDHSFSD